MSAFERQEVTVLELDLDTCANTYGVTPCTAGRKDSGTAQAGAAAAITLAATASAVDDTYNGMTARITGGTGVDQERVISDYTGATRVAAVTKAWATVPDPTSTYDVIDRPNGCYNTFQTCQDAPNFIKTVKTWRFVTPGAPVPAGEGLRPYITGVDPVPTEIDLEKGLAPRAKVTVTLADPPDSDIEADPYAATRLAPAGGTFWPRLLARSPHYAGRFARLKTANFTDGWDEAAFTTELYVIENIDPPDSRGQVKITLKDPVKLADRRTLPEATDGKLAAALAADGLSLPLEPGQGALYLATGFVRVGEEIIEYTANAADTLAWPGLAFRGRFGTTAKAAGEGDGVQLCQVWQDARVHQVLDDLLAGSGIPAANIDSAGFLAEDDQWLGPAFQITAVISEPEKISALLSEVLIQIGAYMWWDPVAQLARFRVIAPQSPGSTPVASLTEAAHLIEDSVKVERLDDLRLTRVALFYDIASATSNRRDASSYLTVQVTIDADAEGTNEYNEVRSEARYSRWFGRANARAVSAAVNRRVARYRDAPQRIHVALDAKDASVKLGKLIDVTMAQVVGLTGLPETVRALVTYRKNDAGRIALRQRATALGKRYGFIAPAGAGDYPADSDYAHVAPASGKFADGSDAYVIF